MTGNRSFLLLYQKTDGIFHPLVPAARFRQNQQDFQKIIEIESRKCQLGQLLGHRFPQIVALFVHVMFEHIFDPVIQRLFGFCRACQVLFVCFRVYQI